MKFLKEKKIILYRQIKELEMEYDIGNLESDDFKNRRAELKSEVSLIIDKIKKIDVFVNKICKSFNRIRVIESLSFSQSNNEFIAFMGNNGSGKTTTLRILARA